MRPAGFCAQFGRKGVILWSLIIGASVGFLFGLCLLSVHQTSIFIPYYRAGETGRLMKRIGLPEDMNEDAKLISNLRAIEYLQKETRRIALRLYREQRLLCWVMSEPKGKDKRAAIMETWGKRCQLTLFMVGAKKMSEFDAHDQSTNESSNESFTRTVASNGRRRIARNAYIVYLNMEREDHYDNLWSKTRAAFLYIHQHFRRDYDWALKVDDDSFVIVENLRLFLRDRNLSDPYYYGCQYQVNAPHGYASGGPGYVISRINVDKLVEQLKMTMEPNKGGYDECGKLNGPEDVRFAQCLAKLDIAPFDTRDNSGRFRFLPFTPEMMINHETMPSRYNWFWSFSAHKLSKGFQCCSDAAISFHYITPSMIRTMEYLIYYVHPFSAREIWA